MGLFDGTSLERPVTCPACGKARADCACPRDGDGSLCPPRMQEARVRREKRRGKWTTVVTGLDPAATDLQTMTRLLKTRHAAGGTATADGLELQGDHRDAVVQYLKDLGYHAKASGG